MRQKDSDLSTAKESVTQQFQADLAAAEAATVAAQQQLEQVRCCALPCLCCKCVLAPDIMMYSLFKISLNRRNSICVVDPIQDLMGSLMLVTALCLFVLFFSAAVWQ